MAETDIKKSLRKFLPHLLDAKTGQLREAETVQRIERFFEHVLDYDGLADISREAQIKGKYCDLAIKIDGTVAFLVEAKACCEPLRDRHVDQAQQYASKANIRWVVLTNGLDWRLYLCGSETPPTPNSRSGRTLDVELPNNGGEIRSTVADVARRSATYRAGVRRRRGLFAAVGRGLPAPCSLR